MIIYKILSLLLNCQLYPTFDKTVSNICEGKFRNYSVHCIQAFYEVTLHDNRRGIHIYKQFCGLFKTPLRNVIISLKL